MRATSQPGLVVGPENPYPGMDGITRSKPAPASGPISSRKSAGVDGQPWHSSSGSPAPPRACRKWICCPSMTVVNCGIAFSRAAWACQSYPWRQYAASSRTRSLATP